jgi:hypothetical protein
MYQHHPLQDSPKFTKIRIFGLKIYHLAALLENGGERKKIKFIDLCSKGNESMRTSIAATESAFV